MSDQLLCPPPGVHRSRGDAYPFQTIVLLVVLLTGTTGCDDVPFDPFPAAEPIYSVAGFLNAASDTQWVRVMPIREQIATSQSGIDALVTLERLPAGESAVLIDSIFRFDEEELPGADDAAVHNFWTTLPILPGASYRFRVERSDGASAQTVVAIPEDFAITVIHHPTVTPLATVRLEGIDHLAMIHVRLKTAGLPCYSSIYPIPAAIDGVHSVTVTRSFPPEAGLLCDLDGDVDVFVVASGSPWPAGARFDQEALNVPSVIERGVGFLGGVMSRAAPWERCTMDQPGENCELTYGPESATLVADIRADPCGEPAYGAEVRLTEIPTAPGARRRIRAANLRPGVEARIDALEGGRLYDLDVTHPDPSYADYRDTIRFETGEVAKRTFLLQRSTPC